MYERKMESAVVRTVRTWTLKQRILGLVILAAMCALLWQKIFNDDDGGDSLRAALKEAPAVDGEEDPGTFLEESEEMEQEPEEVVSNGAEKAVEPVKKSNPVTEPPEDEDEEPPTATFVDDGDDDPDEEEDPDFEPAPRTHHGPYNEINPAERYFIYSPSGGFNNQREELVNAIEIARLLNRTLYVPMAARHTNFFSTYEHLKGPQDLFSMDRILDFPFIESYGVKVVPLNITITRMVAKFIKEMGESKVEIIYHPQKPNPVEMWHKEHVLALRSIQKSLLFIRGRGFYHRWFTPAIMTSIRRHTRYSEYLRKLSVKIVEKTFGKNFYAMHVRLGDYRAKYGSVTLFIGGLVRVARVKNWRTKKYPLYVATDDVRKSRDDFGPIYQNFGKVLFADDIPGDLVKEFRSLFPKHSKMADDMMGILEQLICAQALDFVGTSTSTFSSWISTMRALRAYTFPEIGAVAPPPDADKDDLRVANRSVVKTTNQLVWSGENEQDETSAKEDATGKDEQERPQQEQTSEANAKVEAQPDSEEDGE